MSQSEAIVLPEAVTLANALRPGGSQLSVPEALNPFLSSTTVRRRHPEEPDPNAYDSAKALAETYRSLCDRISKSLEELESSQEQLAIMMLKGQQCNPPDEELDANIFLVKDGIELRMREFHEECRRLAIVERRFQRSVDRAEADLELDAMQASGLIDPKMFDRLLEQRRVMANQQDELDHMNFEKQVLSDDIERLREENKTQLDDEVDFGDGGFEVLTTERQSMQPEALVASVLRFPEESQTPAPGGKGRGVPIALGGGKGKGVTIGGTGTPPTPGVSIGGRGRGAGGSNAGVPLGRPAPDQESDSEAESGTGTTASEQPQPRRQNPMLLARAKARVSVPQGWNDAF